MAVGNIFATPEAGWIRYDNNDARIIYSEFSNEEWGKCYNSTLSLCNVVGGSMKATFYGRKIRVIGYHLDRYSTSVSVKIDGIDAGSFSQNNNSSEVVCIVDFERTDLSLDVHTIEIINNEANYCGIDSIDIEDTGILLTNGFPLQIVDSLSKLTPGKCITCEYTAPTEGAVGTFSNVGTSKKMDIPLNGSATPDGKFLLVCVGYDTEGKVKLIADRNVQHSINWDPLAEAGFDTGVDVQIGNTSSVVYLLSGDSSGSTKESEWDKIIMESNLGGAATPADNTIWNFNTIRSWTSSMYDNYPVVRTGNSDWTWVYRDFYDATTGFRPAMLIVAQVNQINKKMVTPYHVYAPQHDSFKTSMIVTNTRTKAAAPFRLLLNEEEISASDFATERVVPLHKIKDGLNTIEVETTEPVERIGSVSVFKEPLYRNASERTFLEIEDGYGKRNVIHTGFVSIEKAKTKTGIANGVHYEIQLTPDVKTVKV